VIRFYRGETYRGSFRLDLAVEFHPFGQVLEPSLGRERPEEALLDGHAGQADDQNQRRLHLSVPINTSQQIKKKKKEPPQKSVTRFDDSP